MDGIRISLYEILEQSNRIAGIDNIEEFISQYQKLFIHACGGKGCIVNLFNFVDSSKNKTIILSTENNAFIGDELSSLINTLCNITLNQKQIIQVTQGDHLDHGYAKQLVIDERYQIENIVSVPMAIDNQVTGIVQLIDASFVDVEILRFLGNRFALDLRNAEKCLADKIRTERLECMVDIFGRITSTLDKDQILSLIIEYAYKILSAEAGSLFFLDEKTGESILYISSNLTHLVEKEVRVPSGQGIIGTVIKTGNTIIANDVSQDERHYDQVDKQSGQATKSILAVPLIARTVVLGGLRGSTEQRIIGGIEAINKVGGEFDEEDAELLRTLANQAATVLEIAQLYMDANDLFLSSIKALTAAIDAKDSYTEGHSQRVSEISVEIARELGLSDREIYQIQIGSLLHDVGKIGISDSVLKKPGKLTAEEYEEMKKHPVIGENIMGKLHLLSTEILAVAEHHERPDGSGYPRGLKDGEISLFGRIVAVADVFDAMTSDRPYRKSLTTEAVFEHLWNGIGKQFDGMCVEALYKIYQRGELPMQKTQMNLEQDLFKIALDTTS